MGTEQCRPSCAMEHLAGCIRDASFDSDRLAASSAFRVGDGQERPHHRCDLSNKVRRGRVAFRYEVLDPAIISYIRGDHPPILLAIFILTINTLCSLTSQASSSVSTSLPLQQSRCVPASFSPSCLWLSPLPRSVLLSLSPAMLTLLRVTTL